MQLNTRITVFVLSKGRPLETQRGSNKLWAYLPSAYTYDSTYLLVSLLLLFC